MTLGIAARRGLEHLGTSIMVHTGKVAENLKEGYIGVIIGYIRSSGESNGK